MLGMKRSPINSRSPSPSSHSIYSNDKSRKLRELLTRRANRSNSGLKERLQSQESRFIHKKTLRNNTFNGYSPQARNMKRISRDFPHTSQPCTPIKTFMNFTSGNINDEISRITINPSSTQPKRFLKDSEHYMLNMRSTTKDRDRMSSSPSKNTFYAKDLFNNLNSNLQNSGYCQDNDERRRQIYHKPNIQKKKQRSLFSHIFSILESYLPKSQILFQLIHEIQIYESRVEDQLVGMMTILGIECDFEEIDVCLIPTLLDINQLLESNLSRTESSHQLNMDSIKLELQSCLQDKDSLLVELNESYTKIEQQNESYQMLKAELDLLTEEFENAISGSQMQDTIQESINESPDTTLNKDKNSSNLSHLELELTAQESQQTLKELDYEGEIEDNTEYGNQSEYQYFSIEEKLKARIGDLTLENCELDQKYHQLNLKFKEITRQLNSVHQENKEYSKSLEDKYQETLEAI